MKFKKYWYLYVLAILAVIYAIISLVKNEWNPANWFVSDADPSVQRSLPRCPPGQVYGFNNVTLQYQCHPYSS